MSLRTSNDLHQYQHKAVEFILDKERCALFLPMGMGKSIITLTAIDKMLNDFAVTCALIIAPLRVANTVWAQEAKLWGHTKGLNIVVCTGTERERKDALSKKADITVINRENIPWLVKVGKWRWDMVVIDESSSFKSSKSKRFRALKAVAKHFTSVVLLTGTPAPNGQMDLWSQMFLIDQGARLFKTITNFRSFFFKPAGFGGYSYEILPGAADDINTRISDVCMSLRAEDYLNVPPRVDVTAQVILSHDLQEKGNKQHYG